MTVTAPNTPLGWADAEVLIDEPTRRSRLRWAIVVAADLAPGAAVNAAACLAAQTGATVHNLLGPAGRDADGVDHPGLPWAGCTVLAAPADRLSEIHRAAVGSPDMWVCGMPASAQTNRVYADYLRELAGTRSTDLALRAIALFGPRNRVDKLTGKLELLR